MKDTNRERLEQLLNLQRTCNTLLLFQPILLGFFLAIQVDWFPLPVLIFLQFFSSSVFTLLANEYYQWIDEYCEEIGGLSPWFFGLYFSNNKYLKNLEDTRTGKFLFLFFYEDHLKISTGSFLCNATWLGMLQIVVSHFLVEFSYGKMCACHFKIIFKHMEKSFVLAKCGNLVRNGLALS